MHRAFVLCLLASAALFAQQPPQATDLPGKPFYIKQTWTIGGEGNWGYMVLDPSARQLFVAHGHVVQVVDVGTGRLSGEISGLAEARDIALDENGVEGYISDGPAGQVKIFDRATFKVVASVATGPSPRAIVFEPQSRLIFAVGADPAPAPRPADEKARSPHPVIRQEARSSITVIDAQTRAAIATILLPGRLGFAQAGEGGRVYVNVEDQNQVARLDAQAILAGIREASPNPSSARVAAQSAAQKPAGAGVLLDWSAQNRPASTTGNRVRFLSLGAECSDPRALAVDAAHERLFAGCGNMKMVVLDAATGNQVTSLPIGPGVDAVGYDAGRGLIYAANGGAQGTLTIIRQDVTDTYSEIQNLATRQRARTLAVNTATGEVYLVTDVLGVKVDPPGGIGTLQMTPIQGSFQVLVIGN